MPTQSSSLYVIPQTEIYIDQNATPKVSNTPAKVPLHWQQRMQEDLLRDEALGGIERVSSEFLWLGATTFPVMDPFYYIRHVPVMSWKSVTGAWNG